MKGVWAQADLDWMATRVEAMVETERLTSRDIALSWMARCVLPLQKRSHKMCHLSTANDPTRTSRKDVPYQDLRNWASMISKFYIKANWAYSCPPYIAVA